MLSQHKMVDIFTTQQKKEWYSLAGNIVCPNANQSIEIPLAQRQIKISPSATAIRGRLTDLPTIGYSWNQWGYYDILGINI